MIVARFLLIGAACLLPLSNAQAARVESVDGLPVVYLSGSPYQIGRQHGEALREQVRRSVGDVLGFFRRYLKLPLAGTWATNWWLDSAWNASRPYVPREYLDELRGVADGAGVPLRELYRLHAVPDRTYSCSNFAAWGKATAGGRLIHMRNLDWNIDAGIQRYAAVFVVRPAGKQPFINIGWAGFIGALTGVNAERISVGQVGAETADVSFRGEPMMFLMRRVLEQARSLDDAEAIVRGAARTVGVNYVIADAKARRGIVLETTRRHVRRFNADDPAEHALPDARPVQDAVFRADTAMDPVIRERQIASGGDPRRPGLEPPSGSAYHVRYLGQQAGLLAHYGALDAKTAQEIAGAVAPDSNVQSVIFAWPEVWVANAEGRTRAARTTYRRLDAARLLQK